MLAIAQRVGTNHQSALRSGYAVALVFGSLFASSSSLASTTSGNVTVVTVRPLSLVNTEDLNFGNILRGTAAGTVVINPTTGARTTTGGVTAAGGSPSAAQFFTYSTGNQTLQVRRGPLPILNRVGGGATMNVTQLTLNGPVNRFVGPSGVLDLRVGGALSVAANQLDGVYAGTFQIIVTYF